MSEIYKKCARCYQSIKNDIPFVPDIAIVLGSGLGDFAESIKIEKTIGYHTISEFPVSTVPGHRGRFVFGYIDDIKVVCMQGRVHYYEGYTIQDVVLPIRLLNMMGAKILFLTNAAGGINPSFNVGDFMMITDHISNFVPSPLIGKNIGQFGLRFPDMSCVYKPELQEKIRLAANDLAIDLKEGVYIQFTGPNFETPSEVSMARIVGASAVGMSTACEAMVGNHMNMNVCGISLISNMACGLTNSPLSHEEVNETAGKAGKRFIQLATQSIKNMKELL